MDERPVWRQLFDAWEKAVGPRLEEYVQTDQFAERMSAFQQENRRMAEMNDEATRRFLRSWNLPTASDLDKLSQQLADIDRRLRALTQRVDEAALATGPRKRQGSKTPAGMKAALESREAAATKAGAARDDAGTTETVEAAKSSEATRAKTSRSAKSSVASQKATSHSKASGSKKASTARNNANGKA